MGQGRDVGGHAPPPALAEPQPRRALLRRRAYQSTLGARVGALRHARSARAAERCAHDAASTKGAASTRALALPPSAQGRGAEVRGGCSVPLGARAAWARQMRGEHACGCPDKLSPSKRTALKGHPRKPPKSMDPDAEESYNSKHISGKTFGRLRRRLAEAPRCMHSAPRSTDCLNITRAPTPKAHLNARVTAL